MEAGTTMIKRGGKASPVLYIRATSMRFRGGASMVRIRAETVGCGFK